MSDVTADGVRGLVRETYGKIAREGGTCCAPGAGCCGPGDASRRIGYGDGELAAVPEGADMGLGCGNPHAIAALADGETVLDLGSGGGLDVLLAAKRVGPRGKVIGVDMTPEMIAKARANAAKAGAANVELRLGEIEHLPVADASVDVILSNCVINLSPDKRAVFREALRVLKQGGRLAISDVVATAPMTDALRADVRAYTGCVAGAAHVDELRAMLEEVGFADVRITVDEKSRALMRDWFPGSDAAGVVASATIEATKGTRACCAPGCCT
jgi:SAM-dependent methyltransferase